MVKLAALTLLISGIILPELVGFLRDDYASHANYLSELGAIGVPYADLINFAGFLPVALITFGLVIVLLRNPDANQWLKVGLVCLTGVSVGYLGAVLFRCDYGCPADGSLRQNLHNLAGLVSYIGAIAGLTFITFGLRSAASNGPAAVTLCAALLVVTGFALMLIPDLQSLRGAAQRPADYSIFLWFAFASFTFASRS